VFLGDGGSMLLGTLVMVYILFTLGESYSFRPKLVSNKTFFVILILFYPLIDLLRVFILRIKDGLSPFVADRRHIHHYLLERTKSSKKTTFILIVSQLILIYITLVLL
jgi:UDP-N-acetylmuramyl pentapeptide phosphotransferase/UDP-N-acetylglucosamine-1-phosphate transferase